MDVFEPKKDGFFIRHPKIVTTLMIVILALAFIFNTCFTYIRPNEYGIKQVNIGWNKGLQKKVYETGLQFVMPFGFQKMFRFPKDIQILEMTNTPRSRASNRKSFQKAVRIQTSDGFFVDVDLSIIYSISDPYKLITTIGPGKGYIKLGILPKAEPILKESLGALTTENFYNSPLRVKKMEEAEALLKKDLESKGILIEHVLIRYFRYSDVIQRNIEEKKLKDQSAFRNQSESRAAEQRNKLRKVTEEGEAKIRVRIQEGLAYVVKKNADADLYSRKRKAEANLMVALAEAQKTKMKNEALKSPGIDRRVAIEMAKTLEGVEVIVLPSTGAGGVNPLDLNQMLTLFGMDHASKNRL